MERFDLLNPKQLDGLLVHFNCEDGSHEERVILYTKRDSSTVRFIFTELGEYLEISGFPEDKKHLYVEELIGYKISRHGFQYEFNDIVYSFDYVDQNIRLYSGNNSIYIKTSY